MQSEREHNVRPATTSLAVLTLVLGAIGIALFVVAGRPALPTSVPAPNDVGSMLRGSDLPLAAIGYALVDAAWLVWAWIVLSMLLRVALGLADRVADGAEWLARLRAASDRVTLPIVRRAVDSALAAAIVANVAVRAVAVAAAEPLPQAPVTVSVAPPDTAAATAVPHTAPRTGIALHTVRPGESLWSIAEQFYGSGREYARIVDANVDRRMVDGQAFGRSGVIQPGWSLRVPLPSSEVEQIDGKYWYTVEPGDTLWGISGRLLGDETRWPELFDANQGARLADGRTLTNPDLIWPDLRLQLPPPVVGFEGAETPDVENAPVSAVPAATAAEPSDPAAVSSPAPVADGAEALDPRDDMLARAELLAFAGIGSGLATAGAVYVGRRRGRHELLELPLNGEPQTDVPIRGGFAELDLVRGLDAAAPRHPALVLAARAQQTLGTVATVVGVQYGRLQSRVLLQHASAESRGAVRGLSRALADRLGGPVTIRATAEGESAIDIRGAPSGAVQDGLRLVPLVPVAVLPDRREVWLEPDHLGHVLVASLPSGGAIDIVLGLLMSLVVHRENLRVWTIAASHAELPSVVDGLPNQVRPRADARNALEVESALRDVRAELIHRMQEPAASAHERQPILLVVGELARLDYAAHQTTLDMLATYGPAHGVCVLAATQDASAVPSELLDAFAMRLVLRTANPEESQRLLGQPDAVDLLGGGQLLLRWGSRPPREAYGLRVRPDGLLQLVRLLRARRGLPPLDLSGADLDRTGMTEPSPRVLQTVDGESAVDEDAREAAAGLIHVRCFGGFEVHGPLGELVPTIEELTRDAAWDILAVLAAEPEGGLETAALLARVWPDAPRESAETALRAALDSLRTLLARAQPDQTPPDAVRFGPGETCHLDTRRVVSDVHRFLRLCRVAPLMQRDRAELAWRRARGLYRGDLLDGPGARAWPWASRPDAAVGSPSLRERYRDHAYQATLALARLAASDGRLDEAVGLYHELLDAEPTLEDVVRELCRLYAELGDMDAIWAEETRLTQALQRAYLAGGADEDPLRYEPEAATTALFAQARQRSAPPTARPVAAGPVG